MVVSLHGIIFGPLWNESLTVDHSDHTCLSIGTGRALDPGQIRALIFFIALIFKSWYEEGWRTKVVRNGLKSARRTEV